MSFRRIGINKGADCKGPYQLIESGVVLVELALILPFVITMIYFLFTFANYFNQSFWAEQTAYNAALIGGTLESELTVSEKEARIKKIVETLTQAHYETGTQVYMNSFDPPKIEVFDPNAPAAATTTDRLTSVAVMGKTAQLIKTFHQYKAPILSNSDEVPSSPFFASSGSSSEPNCCGVYGASDPSACVSESTGSKSPIQYANCSISTVGYMSQ
jgi:hypothetical protein